MMFDSFWARRSGASSAKFSRPTCLSPGWKWTMTMLIMMIMSMVTHKTTQDLVKLRSEDAMNWASLSSSSSSKLPRQVLKPSQPSSASWERGNVVPADRNVPLMSGLRLRGNALRQPATPMMQGTCSIETFNANGG
eukprot:5848662-Pyramimonas_sp.AAC.1